MRDIWEYDISVLQNKKVIIYGTGKLALEFAIRLINNDIYFDCFLYTGKENIETAYLMNKRVLDEKDIRELQNEGQKFEVVASPQIYKSIKENVKKENRLFQVKVIENICRDIFDKKIIIYGAGNGAKELFDKFLIDFEYEICDSAKEKWGSKFFNTIIVNPNDLDMEHDKNVFIITCRNYEDIERTLLNRGVKAENIIIDYTNYVHKNKIHIMNDKYYFGNHSSFQELISAVYAISRTLKEPGGGILLYGNDELVKSAVEKFRILDIEFTQVFERESIEEDGTVFELLSFDKYYCLLADGYSEALLQYIELIGMDINRFYWLDNYSSYYNIQYNRDFARIIDPILGFCTIRKDDQYPGFIEYSWSGERKEKPVIIVTSGGSTTSAYYTCSCWSRFLSQILQDCKVPHRIYCGATESHKTSQELLKLIRDGINLSPDIFITFNGINEVSWMGVQDFSFHNCFHETMCKKMLFWAKKQEASFGTGFNMEDIYYGIKSRKSPVLMWYENNRMMYEICKMNNISFKAFLQPCLITKKEKGIEDMNCLATLGIFADEEDGNIICTTDYARMLAEHNLFETEAKQYCGEYIEDFTEIFNQEDGCYMDSCHVFEKGNRIIAEKIYLSVRNTIVEKRKEKECIF